MWAMDASQITAAFENRLDVDDRSAVDCLQMLHLKPAVPVYAQKLSRGAGLLGWAGPENELETPPS